MDERPLGEMTASLNDAAKRLVRRAAEADRLRKAAEEALAQARVRHAGQIARLEAVCVAGGLGDEFHDAFGDDDSLADVNAFYGAIGARLGTDVEERARRCGTLAGALLLAVSRENLRVTARLRCGKDSGDAAAEAAELLDWIDGIYREASAATGLSQSGQPDPLQKLSLILSAIRLLASRQPFYGDRKGGCP